MKVNVKGLVFVGFAAAILSGAAKAEGENIVTSKAYTDATYQTKINGGNDEGKAVIAGSTAGSPTYRAITNSGSSLDATSTSLVTEKAVAEALAAAAGGAGSSFEVTSNKLDGTSGSTIGETTDGANGNDTTMYPSAAAVKEYVTSTLASGGTSNSGYEEKANKVSSIASGEESSTTKYTSNAAVTGYAQAKSGNYTWQIAGANGGWLDFKDGQYTHVQQGTTAKDVTVELTNIGTRGVADTANNIESDITSTSTKLTTGKAVKEYVDAAISASESDTALDLSGKQNNLGGTVSIGGVDTNVNGRVVTATGTAGEVTYTAIDSAVASGSNNLITSDAVYDALHTGANGEATYQSYSSTAHQISDGAGGWEALDTTINTTTAAAGTAPTTGAVKSYVDTQDALDEKVANKLDGTTGHTIADTTSSNDTTLYPSAAAVKQYVSSQTGGQAIPAKDTTVCTASLPCALVAEGNRLNWRVMAVSANQTTAAGTCGNANDNCGDTQTQGG